MVVALSGLYLSGVQPALVNRCCLSVIPPPLCFHRIGMAAL